MAMFFPIVSFFLIRGAFSAVNLSPKTAVIIENSSLELNCSYSGTRSVTQWDKSDENLSAFVTVDCERKRFLQGNLFAVSCDKTWTFVKMLSVNENQNKVIWSCSLPGTNKTSTSQVTVIVPVISAKITSGSGEILSIEENMRTSLECSTSISRPAPHVFWFLKRTDMDSIRDISNKASQTPSPGDDNNLVHVKSVLEYIFNRTDNGYHIYCVATNTLGPNVTSSAKIVNIIFPPTLMTNENGSTYRFIENKQASLSCTATGGNPMANLTWNCFSDNVSSTEYNKTVSSTVSWKVFRNQDNQSCVCVADHILRKSWISVHIEVLYPPDTPIFRIGNRTIERIIRIIENNSLVIKCETNSNPSSSYKWNTETTNQALIVANVVKQNAGEYICTVNNTMIATDGNIQLGTNSSSIELEVLYPPSRPFFTYSDHKTYVSEPIIGNQLDVVEGDIFTIACRSTGNPTPSYLWDDGKIDYYYVINAGRSINKTCTATNVMIETVGGTKTGSNTATISIFVYYPPNIPKIRLSNGKDQEILAKQVIHIIENETVILSCYSESKPVPKYIWRVNTTTQLQGQNVFNLESIRRHDAGTYTCHVNNVMNRTFGTAEAGNNKYSTLLKVLYPPELGPLTDISLKEESSLNYTCPVIHGIPLNTTVFWTRKNDSKRWNNSHLIILNVSRADDTTYTCTVFNEMIPTVGNATKRIRSGDFHLNIFFSAIISSFSVLGKDGKEITVVIETEEVPLSCTAEANPASNITITGPKQDVIAMVSNTNIVHHTLRNVSYVNAGQYICTGRNNYTNDKTPNSKLILIVRCPPRPSSAKDNDGKVATALHADIILQFKAHDFLDEQDKTVFMWFKDNVPVESHASKFSISSSGLQSNLTVSNVTEKDFGQYIVRVTNSVGSYIHNYVLQAKDKPEVPMDFSYSDYSITDSSVTVNWVPGFNGGYHQNFIVLYKRITDHYWQNKSIGDTGDRHMNYTVFGLLSKSEYQVKMFARNEEGDSPYTNELQFATKAPVAQPIEVSSDMVGIVAGSVSTAVIVSVAGVIVGVFIYRRRSKQKESQKVYYDPQRNTASVANESSLTYETLNESKRERDLYSQLPASYEQLDNASRERNAYSEIENTGHDMSDYVNMRI